MEKFQTLSSNICPLDIPNIDTDQIIPKQFLKRVERSGFGEFLFFDWRYQNGGTPNPNFSLNRPEHQGAKILLTRDNFGCGSSREHAPWALLDFGFRSIIAPSFADIFYNNCFQNSILPIVLEKHEIDSLFEVVGESPKTVFLIDLSAQRVSYEKNKNQLGLSFEIDQSRKKKLWEGLDDIATTLRFEKEIQAFEGMREVRKA